MGSWVRACVDAWMHGWGTYSRVPEVHVGSVAHGHVSRRDAVVVGAADELAGMVHLSKFAVGFFFFYRPGAHWRSSADGDGVDGVWCSKID